MKRDGNPTKANDLSVKLLPIKQIEKRSDRHDEESNKLDRATCYLSGKLNRNISSIRE